jgi:membrane fusion protein (multidrug efflux system)
MPDDLGHLPTTLQVAAGPAPAAAPIKDADAKRLRKRKIALITLGAVAAKVAIGFGVHWVLVGQRYVSTDNAYVGAATAAVNSQVSGPILEVRADDTQQVRKGQVLAVIDPADARLAEAKAAADYRRILQRVSQYYPQSAGAAATVAARQAEFERANTDYSRRRALAATGAVSQEELTVARTALDAARANLAAAREAQKSQQALTTSGPAAEHPEVAVARAAWESAKLNLERTVVRAPVDGVVVQRHANVGQRAEPGQALMSVTPLREAYVDANFKEGQLGKVRLGQPVRLTSDYYGSKVVYHGRVAGLGGGTGSAFAVIPAQNATGNWIKVVQRVPVRIALDPAELAERPLRVGVSMTARIDLKSQAS